MEIKEWLKKHWLVIVILAVIVVVRLVYLVLLHPPLIWIDASQYDELGWSLANQGTYALKDGVAFAGREPGYPLFFLAPFYFLFGHQLWIIQLFQIILSAVCGWLIFRLGRKYFSQSVGLWAALFFALYPPFIAYSSEILTEIPFTFLLLLFVTLFLEAWERKLVGYWVGAGVVLGIATLTRFIVAFLPLFLAPLLWFFRRDYQRVLKISLGLMLLIMIIITPWLCRNWNLYHRFVFGRLGGGEIYWSGSYLPWDGEWKGMVDPLPELEGGLTPDQIDRKLTHLAFENIKSDPIPVVLMWLKKPFKIFFKSEFNAVLERDNSFSAVLKSFSVAGPAVVKGILLGLNIVLVLFFVWGSMVASRHQRFLVGLILAIVGYFILFYLPLNPDSRYKLPPLALMLILSARGFIDIIGRLKNRKGPSGPLKNVA